MGDQDRIVGLQYGNPIDNKGERIKKISDTIFNAFADGTIELVAFPYLFVQDIIDGLNKAGLDGEDIAGSWFLPIYTKL